MKSKFKNRLAQ